MSEKHARDILPFQEKDVLIKKKPTDELSELREKYTTESRAQQQELITNITKTETLQLEKTNLDKVKERLVKEKLELTSQLTNLQKKLHNFSEEKQRMEEKLDSEKTKNRQLEAHVGPLEKKAIETETKIREISEKFARENEEKIERIRKLETELGFLLEEREFLLSKVDTSERVFQEKTEQLKKNNAEFSEKYQNQSKTIERLMLQKRNVMFQLANEVKRNGILVKENSELNQTIHVQQQIIADLGVSPEHQNGTFVSKKERHVSSHVTSHVTSHPPPSVQTQHHLGAPFPHVTSHVTSIPPPLPDKNNTFVHQNDRDLLSSRSERDLSDVVVVQSGSWLSSVPLFGPFLSPPKTFRKKFEVIV